VDKQRIEAVMAAEEEDALVIYFGDISTEEEQISSSANGSFQAGDVVLLGINWQYCQCPVNLGAPRTA